MANEIQFAGDDYGGNNTLYFVVFENDTELYVSGDDLVEYASSDWSDYAVALALNADTDRYQADFPSVRSGTYYVRIYERAGASPATTDTLLAEGEFEWSGVLEVTSSDDFTEQMILDVPAFLEDFGEDVVYTQDGVDKEIVALVTRNLPKVVSEDGQTLTDYLLIAIANDETIGIEQIKVNRDTVTVAAVYGGAAREYVVRSVESSDAGMYRLRVR